MEDNDTWKCKYCDKQFPKEGKWETYQKITFTESQMKSLGRTYNDMNDTSPVKDTKWFDHLMRIPGTEFVTCKKRRCIECYMEGKVFKFDTRSGWQKHQATHHGNAPYEPKHKKIKERRTKLQKTIDDQVKPYVKEIMEELSNKHKVTNVRVEITWDSEAPKCPVVSEKDEERILKARSKKYAKINKNVQMEIEQMSI